MDPLVNLPVCQRAVTVCFRGGLPGGWVDVRVDVLRAVSMYVSVCRCVDA